MAEQLASRRSPAADATAAECEVADDSVNGTLPTGSAKAETALSVHARTSLGHCRQPCVIEFADIRLDGKAPKGGGAPHGVPRGVSGCLHPGRLTAILGPPGAGKTSLLRFLSGHRTEKGVRGSILVNGRQRGSCRHLCSLIARDFALLGALTVRETLRDAAELKLCTKCSAKDRKDVVNDIVAILGLEACVDTRVSNLSGGEKRRVSIGVELVTDPPVMFFDEPTSGLDMASSVQVMAHLQSLARAGRTVVVALHQPSSRLVQLTDNLLVLGAGRALYCGPTVNAAGAFHAAGFACPALYNVADFVVEVASGEHGHDLDALTVPGGAARGRRWPTSSPFLLDYDETFDVIVDLEEASSAAPGRTYPAVPFCEQFVVLFRRSLLVSLRDRSMAWLRSAVHLIVAVILGLLFKDFGNDAPKILENFAFLFFFFLFLFYANAMPTVLSFPLEAAVFFRERSNNWYFMPAYFFSKVLVDLPFMIVNPTVSLLTAFYLTDQPTDNNRLWMAWLVCFLTVLLAHAYGLVFGAAFGTQLGGFLVPATTIPLILFSGFFLYLPNIPDFLRRVNYLAYFRHGFEGIVFSVYGMDRQKLKCSRPYCRFKDPSSLLDILGMSDAHYWYDVLIIIVWIIKLHVLLLVTLKRKAH